MNLTTTPLNAVIGDAGFIAHFGRVPTRRDTEVVRIDHHLDFVLRKLLEADTSHLSVGQRQKRMLCIRHLQTYRRQRVYPQNTYIAERTPVFIDQTGRLCAVGYLIAQTVGIEHAELISRKHQLDRIEDIDPALYAKWADAHGLHVIELAMIQPAYGDFDPIAANHFLTGAALAMPLATAAVFWLHGSLRADRKNRIARLALWFMVVLGVAVAGATVWEMVVHTHQWTKNIEWAWWAARIGFGSMIALGSWRLLYRDDEVDNIGPKLTRWSLAVLSVIALQSALLPSSRDCYGTAKKFTYVGAVVPFVVPYISPYTAPPPILSPSPDPTVHSGIGFVEGCGEGSPVVQF